MGLHLSRWTYKTFEVRVGDNVQHVRGLTADERGKFAALPAMIKKEEMPATELPIMVVQMGAVNPPLSIEDVRAMPSELLDACAEKIMEMTAGVGKEDPGRNPGKNGEETPEKKVDSPPTDSAPTN